MTQFSSRLLSTAIDIVPGQIQTYRLPSMSSGGFILHSNALPFPATSHATFAPVNPVGGGGLGNPGGGGGLSTDPGGGGGGGTGPLGNPGVLLIDLLHGDQVVQSGQTLVPQATPADDAWRVRLQLAPGTPGHLTYPFGIDLNFPSLLPILTRRIPLDAFQQAFDKNWNGHNYIYASLNDNKIFLNFDPALVTYYHLAEQVTPLDLPVISLNNARTDPIRLSTGASDSPFTWVQGRFPYIQLDIPVVHTEPNNKIEVSIPVVGSIQFANFTMTFRFYLMSQGSELVFLTRLESDLLDGLPASVREDVRSTVETRIDPFMQPIARALKPWLVGADFDLIQLRHEPATTSVDPAGGFIVVDYVGQQQSGGPVLSTGGTPPPPATTDPPLFVDAAYTRRGDADSMWKAFVPPVFGIDPHPPVEPATTPGSLASIDHIVVVMMENRSFDHMLGYLSLEGGRTDVDGLQRGPDGQLIQVNYFNGHNYYPEHLADTTAVRESPHHGHLPTKAQMADGMKHFVSNYAKVVGSDPEILKLVMGYYGAKELPVYDVVAREFVVCDRWFCSHIGPTWPNRFVTLTGDLNRDSYGEPETDTPDYADLTPVETTTLFDLLTDRHVSWHYFQNRFGTLRTYTRYTFDQTNVSEFDNVVNGFRQTVLNGQLPSVTFIDPSFGDLPPGNDDAPPADLKDGQTFIASILKTALGYANSAWDRTMVIVCYDEHGGFYDHVDPPDTGIPLRGQTSGKLGPRVPAFVLSAKTPARTVLHEVFDHSSIAATILRRFCSPHPPHLSARVTAARDLRNAITLSTPRDIRPVFDPPSVFGNPLPGGHPVGGGKPAVADRATLQFNTPATDDDHRLMAAVGLIVG